MTKTNRKQKHLWNAFIGLILIGAFTPLACAVLIRDPLSLIFGGLSLLMLIPGH